jgi:branched-chain amino acid transport system substrate-binding protein
MPHRREETMFRVATIACAAVLLTVAAAAAQVSDGKVKIGVLTDMSGPFSDNTGQGSVAAAKMAIEEFGGKVAGAPVELVFADHQNKPDVGVSIAREWLDQGGVDAIVDLPNSSVALAVQEIARSKGKVTLFSGGGTADLTGKACSPTGIQWTYDTYETGKAIAEALPQLGKSWFFITADYAFGQALEAGATLFLKKAGGEVVGGVRAPLNSTDFSSFLLQAQASKAQVIALANASNDTVTSLKQAKEFGIIGSAQKMVALGGDIGDIRAIGLDTAQGLFFVEPFYAGRDKDSEAFAQRFLAQVGKMPSFVHAGLYSAVRHYLAAIDAAKTDEPNSVVAKMREMPVNDFFATNGKIREDGRMVHEMYLVQVKGPSESKHPWDYYKIVSAIPGDQAFRPLAESDCPLVKK